MATEEQKMIPERIKKMFGGKVPDYLRKQFAWKAQLRQQRADEIARIEAEKKAAQKRRDALRRPPRNVRMNGMMLEWDAPETVEDRKPLYYIVSEQRPNGTWTVIASHTRHLHDQTHYRAPLIYGIAARVESDYGDGGLGVHFYSDVAYSVKSKPKPKTDGSAKKRIESRETAVIESLDSYCGRFTKTRKVPILSDLKKHCGISDLTRKERNRFFKQWQSANPDR